MEVSAYLFGIIGAGYLITGGITLVKYLRENPAPAPEHADFAILPIWTG